MTGPALKTALPGPRAKALIERDAKVVSTSYTRDYPLVMARGEGALVEDVDGNVFLDYRGHRGHLDRSLSSDVVKAIVEQSQKFLHMSGTDFYYEPQVRLGEELSTIAPMPGPHRSFFANSGTEANGRHQARSLLHEAAHHCVFRCVSRPDDGGRFPDSKLTRSGAVSRRSCRACFTRPTPTAIAVRLGSTPTTAPPSACVSSKSNCSFTSFTRKKWQRLSSSRFKARAATSCRRTCFTNASARSPPDSACSSSSMRSSRAAHGQDVRDRAHGRHTGW